MSLGELLLYSGFVILGVVFLFLRKPGVTLAQVGPIWKAKEFYKPLGVKLYYAGILIGGMGIFLTFFTGYGTGS